MGGLEGRMDGLEGGMGRLEGRMDGLEGRMGGLEGRFDRLEHILPLARKYWTGACR